MQSALSITDRVARRNKQVTNLLKQMERTRRLRGRALEAGDQRLVAKYDRKLANQQADYSRQCLFTVRAV